MIQLPKEFDSIFRYIVVVSQRAEQLINGAKARTDSRHFKPTLVARDDVEAGEVSWRVLTQEELDAHRQALVEQFRAEVDAASERPTESIPDVLPTSAARTALDDDEDRDDELERLQRLLGMTRSGGGAAADDDDDDDDDDEFDEDDEDGSDDLDLDDED
jgi:DNA-directed RNA polymerase subunit K/omega